MTELLERCYGLLARYHTSAVPDDAAVTVDGKPASVEADGTLLLPIGEHRVQVRASDGTADARLTVRGGEVGPLPVVLEARTLSRTEAVPPVTAVPVPPSSSPPPPPAHEDGFPWGPTITTAAGGALLVAGVILLLKGLGDIDDVEQAPDGTEWADVADKHERTPLLTGLGAGFVGTGAALGVAGTVWFVLDANDSASAGAPEGFVVGARAQW